MQSTHTYEWNETEQERELNRMKWSIKWSSKHTQTQPYNLNPTDLPFTHNKSFEVNYFKGDFVPPKHTRYNHCYLFFVFAHYTHSTHTHDVHCFRFTLLLRTTYVQAHICAQHYVLVYFLHVLTELCVLCLRSFLLHSFNTCILHTRNKIQRTAIKITEYKETM